MAKKKKAIKWKAIFEWFSLIGGTIAVFVVPVSVALFISNKQHTMEMIELNQKHNLELQRQHDEFEEKYSDIKKELEDCRHQYRLLEIEKKKNNNEK